MRRLHVVPSLESFLLPYNYSQTLMQHYGEPDPINPGSVGGADIAAAEAALEAEPEGEGPSVEQMYYWALKSIYKYGSDTLSEQADDRGWLRAAVAEMVRRAQESLDYGAPVTPPAPEPGTPPNDAWWRELINEIARVQHVAASEGQGGRMDLAKAVELWCRPATPPAPEVGEAIQPTGRSGLTWEAAIQGLRGVLADQTEDAIQRAWQRSRIVTAMDLMAANTPTPPEPEVGEGMEARESVTHDLKVWSSYFESLLDGTKNFEVRFNDRDFKSGHYLRLREWLNNEYTGRELTKRVTYVLQGGVFGLETGYVALALAAKQSELATLLQQQEAELATLRGVPVVVSERLRQIGHQMRTQDNRCTANPIFQVRGKERIYGLDLSASDEAVWMDDEWNPVDIPEDADPDQPPHGLTVARYTTRWKVLMVAFTEQGCKDHLRLNGHNYRIYDEVGIYVDSLNRCPEMIAIREFLLGLPAPQAGAVQP